MTTFAERHEARTRKLESDLLEHGSNLARAQRVPASVRDQIRHVHNHYKGPHFTFEVDTLADALPILEAFEPVTYYYLTGGTFGHINPREWIKDRDWEGAKEETEFCAPYMVAASGKGWQECKIVVFIRLGEELAKVSIAINHPAPSWVPVMTLKCDDLGRAMPGRYQKHVCGIGETQLVQWASGSPDAARVTRHWHDAAMWQQFVERQQNTRKRNSDP